MKHYSSIILIAFALMVTTGCEKDSITLSNIDDVGLKVTFGAKKSAVGQKQASELTLETPANYYVALKSARLIGAEGTADALLFEEPDLNSSFVFDFTDENTVHSLLQDSEIPDGKYTSIEIEIYYLQMNLAIATQDRGIERRDIRIYLSDDAETEDGLHQPGDMTQINDNQEIGWLLGEGQFPNFDPVSPRTAAYTFEGAGEVWYDFAGKAGQDFGPFGDIEFANSAPHPVYSTRVGFDFKDNQGSEIILDFDVSNCWQFEDKSGDGVFGAADMDPENPTRWHMALPAMTLTLQ